MTTPSINALPPAPSIYLAHDDYAAAAQRHVGAWPTAATQANALAGWISDATGLALPIIALPPPVPITSGQNNFAEMADIHVAAWQTFADQINALSVAVSELLPTDDPPLIAALPPAPNSTSPYTAFAARAKAMSSAWPAFGVQLNAAFAWLTATAAAAPTYIEFAGAFTDFAESLPQPTFSED